MDTQDYLDVAGLAIFLNISPNTIYFYVHKKTIPHFKFGKKLLQAYADQQHTGNLKRIIRNFRSQSRKQGTILKRFYGAKDRT